MCQIKLVSVIFQMYVKSTQRVQQKVPARFFFYSFLRVGLEF